MNTRADVWRNSVGERTPISNTAGIIICKTYAGISSSHDLLASEKLCDLTIYTQWKDAKTGKCISVRPCDGLAQVR